MLTGYRASAVTAATLAGDPDRILSREGGFIVEATAHRIAMGQPPYGSVSCGSVGPVGFQVRLSQGPSEGRPLRVQDEGIGARRGFKWKVKRVCQT